MQPNAPLRPQSRREAIAEALRLDDEDEDAAISELRALVAAVETRADRLLARYCGRPVRPFAHLARDARPHLAPPIHHLREW